MNTKYDKSLVKLVFRQEYRGYLVTASLTRFGGLFVCAVNIADEYGPSWTGSNILEARSWVDSRAAMVHGWEKKVS